MVRLTSDPGDEQRPLWSRDGSHILFTAADPHYKPEVGVVPRNGLWVIRPDGTGEQPLCPDLSGDQHDPDWAADGRVVLQLTPSDQYPEFKAQQLYVTTPGKPLSPLGEGSQPAFSPDGKTIYFNQDIAWNAELYARDAKGVHRLRRLNGYRILPSPDGTSIAFQRREKGNDTIWVAAADGTGARRVAGVPGPGINAHLGSWSPDGKRLSISVCGLGPEAAGSDYQVCTVNADGTRLRVLHPGLRPQWSPDGRSLAFTQGENTVAVCDADPPCEPGLWGEAEAAGILDASRGRMGTLGDNFAPGMREQLLECVGRLQNAGVRFLGPRRFRLPGMAAETELSAEKVLRRIEKTTCWTEDLSALTPNGERVHILRLKDLRALDVFYGGSRPEHPAVLECLRSLRDSGFELRVAGAPYLNREPSGILSAYRGLGDGSVALKRGGEEFWAGTVEELMALDYMEGSGRDLGLADPARASTVREARRAGLSFDRPAHWTYARPHEVFWVGEPEGTRVPARFQDLADPTRLRRRLDEIEKVRAELPAPCVDQEGQWLLGLLGTSAEGRVLQTSVFDTDLQDRAGLLVQLHQQMTEAPARAALAARLLPALSRVAPAERLQVLETVQPRLQWSEALLQGVECITRHEDLPAEQYLALYAALQAHQQEGRAPQVFQDLRASGKSVERFVESLLLQGSVEQATADAGPAQAATIQQDEETVTVGAVTLPKRQSA